MFCDETTVKLGSESVRVRRLTVAELRTNHAIFAQGGERLDETFTRLIADHCTTAAGKPIDPEALSLPQLQTLAKELAGVPEGSPLSDFIAALC